MRTFLAVEHAGSIKGAAAELMVTQPSVSAGLAALEKEVGVRLAERRGRGVALSPAGVAFAPYAAGVLAALEEGRAAASLAMDPERQELRIAAVNTAGEYIVPPVLRAFMSRHPEIDITLEVSNRARVFRQVELREADMGIGGSPPESGALEGVPFLDNEHVVIVAPGSPFASRRGLTFEDLAGVAWLLREDGSGTRIFARELLAGKGIKPRTMTIGSNGAIKQSVRTGLGVSLQSRHAVGLELATGMLAEADLDDGIPRRKWFALYHRDGVRRPAADTFLRFLIGDEARQAIAESLAV